MELILATAPSGHFSLTQYLWIGAHLNGERSAILSAFPKLLHIGASYSFMVFEARDLPQPRGPLRVTLRSKMERIHMHHMSTNRVVLRQVTHLRFAIDAGLHYPRAPMDTLPHATALECVVLESSTDVWDVARLLGAIQPFFLSGPQVRRVLVCAAPNANQLPSLSAALEEYARTHGERRVWLLHEPTNGTLLSEFRHGITFDDEQWSAERPVDPGSE